MKTNRQELLSILNKVRPGLAAKEIVEQATSFLFLDGQISAYNDDVLVSHPGGDGLRGSVQSSQLISLLSKLSDDEIDIETTETEMVIKGGTSEAGLALQAEISERIKAAMSDLVIEHEWKTLPDGFAEILQQACFAAGQDMTKPMLTCVHVTSQYAEACDNYRMARIAFPKRSRIKDLLLPARNIQNLSQYTPTQYAQGIGWMHFKNADGVQFSCRTMEGQYPDLSKLLSVKGAEIQFPEDTLGALERSGVFLDDIAIGNEACTVILSNDTLDVSAKGIVGWIKEKLPMTYQGDKIEFQVLPKALQSILKKHPLAVVGPRSILFKGDGFSYCCSIVASEK
jgi:DNA polymerase III sliding clamp (beta) subunit (PCNA family)